MNSIYLPLILTGLSLVTINSAAQAQVESDNSLSTEINTNNDRDFRVDRGSRVGDNLFHSFREFSIPSNGSVIFNNSPAIKNIINRVTGNNFSNIDGLIQSQGNANLFLINPNGIIFGRNAQLNIGGAFIGTTAESLRFQDGTQFTTNSNNSQTLLTISTPIGLQFGNNPGTIINNSRATNDNNFPVGLAVNPGNTLALIGGEINFDGGILSATGGEIELASVSNNSLVEFDLTNGNSTWNYGAVTQFQNIQLDNLALVNVSGDGAGRIGVTAKNITLTESSQIVSDTFGSESPRDIIINATDSVTLVQARTIPQQLDLVRLLVGREFIPETSIEKSTFGSGAAGNLIINTARLSLQNGAKLRAQSLGSGRGGNAIINASDTVEVSGIGIISNNFLGNISIPGIPPNFIGAIFLPSNISTANFVNGDGGNIVINARNLVVQNGAFITANPFMNGLGGNIDIKADTVSVSGTSPVRLGSNIVTTTFGDGDAGNLTIDAKILEVSDGGLIAASTSGRGNGGNLTVNADSVSVFDASPSSIFTTGVLTQSANFLGRGGNLNLTTQTLEISGRGQIAANGLELGRGQAGNITIFADSVAISDRGLITAETFSGDGGNIRLEISDTLTLRQNGTVSAKALSNANGGNINIDTRFIIAFPQENNDILASAVVGNGGNIDLQALGIFGITQRISQPPNLTNDIDASSQFGLSGTISSELPQTDATQGILALSPQVTDVNYLLENSFCRVSRESNYIVTGRGGIPLSPDDRLFSSNTWEDWTIDDDRSTNSTESRSTTLTQDRFDRSVQTPNKTITPIRGWLVNREGKIVLTAEPNTITPQPPNFIRPGCY
jgi:filamentous hemagglutinin family protein